MTTDGVEGENDLDSLPTTEAVLKDLEAPLSGEEQVSTEERKALGELPLVPDRGKRGWHLFGSKVRRGK